MSTVSPGAKNLFRTTAAFALAAVIMGSVVCATDSGFECGTWPGCQQGGVLPTSAPEALLYKNPWIEMIHRVSAILAGPLALISALVALRLRGVNRWVKILPWIAVAGALVAGIVGRGIVLGAKFPTWIGAADLLSALATMGCMIAATVLLERTPSVLRASRTGRLAWIAVAVLAVMHTVALWAAGPGSYTRCMSWPVWTMVPDDVPALTVVRLGLGVIALALIAMIVMRSMARSERTLAILLATLTALVVILGLVIGYGHVMILAALYSTLTVGVLATLILIGARASVRPQHDDLPHPPVEVAGRAAA